TSSCSIRPTDPTISVSRTARFAQATWWSVRVSARSSSAIGTPQPHGQAEKRLPKNDSEKAAGCNRNVAYWPCAPKARIISRGSIGPVASEQLGRVTGYPIGILERCEKRRSRKSQQTRKGQGLTLNKRRQLPEWSIQRQAGCRRIPRVCEHPAGAA